MYKKLKWILAILVFLAFSAYLLHHAAATTYVVHFNGEDQILSDAFSDFRDPDTDNIEITADHAGSVTGTCMTIGPFYLEKGDYDFIISYQTNVDVNTVEIRSDLEMGSDGTPGVVYASSSLPADKTGVRLSVSVPEDAYGVTLNVTYNGGNLRLGTQNVEVHNGSRDVLCTYLLVLLGCCLFAYLFFFRYRKDDQKASRIIVAALTLLILFMSYPLMTDFLMDAHDETFHLGRIEGIYTALRDGQFPMWFNAHQLHGEGYASPIMYPQLFLYIPALLRLAGMTLFGAYKVFLFLCNAACVVISYFSFKTLFRSRKTGLIVSAFYSLGLYHLVDLYTRASLGEIEAFAFLPLLLLAFYEVTEKDDRRWPLLAIAMTCVLESHILTAVLSVLFMALFFLLRLHSLRHNHLLYRIGAVLKAAVLTVLLNAFFLIPFLSYYPLDMNAKTSGLSIIYSSGAYLTQMFASLVVADPARQQIGTPTTVGEMPMTIGVLSLVVIVAFLALEVSAHQKHEEGRTRLGRYGLFGALLCLFGSSPLCPWELIGKIPGLKILLSMQFSWRLLGFASLFLCLPAGILLNELFGLKKNEGRTAAVRILAISLSLIVCNSLYYMESTREVTAISDEMKLTKEVTDDLYLFEGTSFQQINLYDNIVHSSAEGTTITDYHKKQTSVQFTCTVPEEAGFAELEIPFYNYPGYVAFVNGEPAEITSSEINRVMVEVPAGESTVLVRFEAPASWKAGYLIFLITLILLIAAGVLRKKRSGKAVTAPSR